MKTLLAIDRLVIMIFLIIFMQSEKSSADAQQPQKTGIAPVMKITSQNNNDLSMRLDVLAIDIRVVGKIAVTTLDMTFMNPNNRILEGEFTFPLENGQTVSRFALDIGGKLREGVVIDKEKGRVAFEAIVRRRVDPGLLEMTEGNNFRARVFPLPANGSRRIVIAFDQELTTDQGDDLYLLPLMITEPVRKFSVHAEILKNKVRAAADNQLGSLHFKEWNNSYIADIEEQNFIPDHQIALRFPATDQPVVFTAPRDAVSSWFYINLKPQSEQKLKKLPASVSLLWDHSNSASNRDIAKEIQLLDAYFTKAGNLTVELIPFNIKTGKSQFFEIRSGNWESLRQVLNDMVYDGGTSYGILDFRQYRTDEILFVTDGLSTFGGGELVTGKIPVYCINSSPVANHSFLTGISLQTSGSYIDLSTMGVSEALARLQNLNFHFISAKVEEGNAGDIFPSLNCEANETFGLSGILAGKRAVLNLTFGYNPSDSYSVKVNVMADNLADPVILRRVWATKKIAELSLDEEKNEKQIAAAGREFGVVTRNTSLIVLETLEDYLQYEIVPPEEMKEDYFERVNNAARIKKEEFDSHFSQVLRASQQQTEWWKTVFPLKDTCESTNKYFTPTSIIDDISSDTVMVVEEQEQYSVMRAEIAEDANVPPPPPPPAESSVPSDRRERRHVMAQVALELSDEVNFEGGAPDNKEKVQNGIRINAWDPQTPYLKVLEYAAFGTEYSTYLKLKQEYGATPSFYMDAADFFTTKGKVDTAVTILSNLSELKLEVPQLLRVLGSKLMNLKQYKEAVSVYQKVMDIKGEEPQSYRDLGLAYEAAGDRQKAVNTLYEVIKRNWDGRFQDIEIIVLNEINRILAASPEIDHSFIDDRLIKKEPVDIRVVLTWDTDNCDMDLWVTDPAGEKCFYEHKLTRNGGKISDDFTQGYGPEEFMIRKAIPGEYLVHVNYFGTSSQAVLAPVNLHVTFYTNYGSSNQKQQDVVLRLMNAKEVVEVGKFNFMSR